MVRNNTDFIYLLRFIAALMVVLKHYSIIRNPLINNGGAAVNFFFLLSGFILVLAYEKQIVQRGLSVTEFYVKRIARVYPLYLLALVLCIAYLYFDPSLYSNLGKKLPFEFLMIQSWLYPGSINYPAWSVSCELFFYMLFPLYIVKLNNFRLSRSIFWALVGLVVAVLITYILGNISISFLRPDLKDGYLDQHPFIRFPVFFLGNILGLVYIKNVKIPNPLLICMFLAGCGLLLLWTKNPIEIGMNFKQLGLLLLYTCLLFSLLQNESLTKKWGNPYFILLGDISYGLYLLQNPIYLFVTRYTVSISPMVQFYIYLLILLLASYLSYKFFEKPLRLKIVSLYKASFQSKGLGYSK